MSAVDVAVDAVDDAGATGHADAVDAGRAAALRWAGERVDVSRARVVTDRPWGTVWRIECADGPVWLKLVPPALAGNVAVAPALARLAPGDVPAALAHDVDGGRLLSADHGGRDLRRDPDESVRVALLRGYARLQGRVHDAVEAGAAAAPLPPFRADEALDALLRFLGDGVEGDPDALRFLSRARAARCLGVLRRTAPALRALLARAAHLPPMLEHFDLRPSNAAEGRDGAIVLYDWEEAVAGPPGTSLHGLFGGASTVLEALAHDPFPDDPVRISTARRELDAYVDALAASGPIARDALLEGLGAAAVGGVIGYLAGFARFEAGDRDLRRTVRGNIRRRFGDLLDVCHRLALENGEVPELAAALREHGWEERADALLDAGARRRPDDAGIARALAHRCMQRGAYRDALAALRTRTELGDDGAEPHRDAAACHAALGDFEAAVAARRAASLRGLDASASPTLDRLHECRELERAAAAEGHVPTLVFDPAELRAGRATEATLALAERLFRAYGVLLIRRAFDPEVLAECHRTFLERYRRYLEAKRPDDALRIGDRRLQVTIDMVPPYDAPSLYANPLVLPLMRRVLGTRCTLGCYTSAMSLPGAAEQRLHKDHKALFEGEPDAEATPSFAVTMMLPLVPVDERVGSTRVKKGSHRRSTARSASLPAQTPLTELGDCYLMDYRLSHYGQANRSDSPRPILSLVYQRPWFRDFMNFQGQPSLRIDRDAFERVPEAHRPLLAWTMEPGPTSGRG